MGRVVITPEPAQVKVKSQKSKGMLDLSGLLPFTFLRLTLQGGSTMHHTVARTLRRTHGEDDLFGDSGTTQDYASNRT